MPKLQPRSQRIRDLIDEYQAGKLVIPEFQRDYVWKPNRAPKLLDSLYRNWPISSMLVWQNESQNIERRRGSPKPVSGTTRWLIDGQQRVITLAKVFQDDGIDVVFNGEDADSTEPGQKALPFKLRNAATERDRNWIHVTSLWRDEDYHRIARDLQDNARDQKLREKFERVRRILDYEVPVIEMIDHDFADAVEAFQRINTLGYRLGSEEIESANVAARHSGFIRQTVGSFLHKLQARKVDRIQVVHLFRACAFIARPDGRSRVRLHELNARDLKSAWKATERATWEAVDLLGGEFGLIDMSILWSGTLLVPVIALCHQRWRSKRELAGWMALAALHHRYSGSAATALDEDLRACRHPDPIGALLANLRQRRRRLRARPEDFSGRLLDRGALFAAWVACRQRGARDLRDGAKLGLQARIDRHHILPRARFPERRRSEADALANIAFISGSSNKSIGDAAPEDYLAEIDSDVLRSQCIPTTADLWSVAKADEFWDERRTLLAEAFNDFLDNCLPGRQLGRR